MINLAGTTDHRLCRGLFVLSGLFSTCDALVNNGESAEAREYILTSPRSAHAATLLLAAQDGEANMDASRKNRDIGLAPGLYEQRRAPVARVSKSSRRPSSSTGCRRRRGLIPGQP